MNPNVCTICEKMFRRVKRRQNIEVDATVLFADIRGYTALSQTLDPARMTEILNFFYDICAEAIWRHDGLLNKTIGDAVMAIFNFPIARADHATAALRAAQELRQDCGASCAAFAARHGFASGLIGVGVGIHTGLTSMGEFGRTHKDFTAIGATVNLASRLQSAAAGGEILATQDVLNKASGVTSKERRAIALKGYANPLDVIVL